MIRLLIVLAFCLASLFGQTVTSDLDTFNYRTKAGTSGTCYFDATWWGTLNTSLANNSAHTNNPAAYNTINTSDPCGSLGDGGAQVNYAGLRFDTSGVSGTILGATLYFYVNEKFTQYTPSTSRGIYIRTTANATPVGSSDIPQDIYNDPTTNRIASISMASLPASSAWASVSISNPNTAVNKGGSTMWLMFCADPAPTISTSVNQSYGISLYAVASNNRPYLVLTMAGGARLIVVSDSD